MKMVASAKLHKAQGAIENMLPYERKLNKILTNFLSADLPVESPYIKAREVKRVAIVAFSSNTSLCGAFNANVIKMLLQTVGEFRTLGQDNILIFPVGKKVDEAVKRLGFEPQETSPTLSDKPSYQEASELAHRLMEMYVSGEIDRVELIYHHFKSMGVQILLRETYLAQYRELEAFSKFSSDMDPITAMTIDKGRKNAQLLIQPQYSPMPVEQQIAILYCGTHGLLHDVPLENVQDFERSFIESLQLNHQEDVLDVLRTGVIDDNVTKAIEETAAMVAKQYL